MLPNRKGYFGDFGGKFVPEIHAKWLYDYIGDAQQTTSTFTGGGASFTTRGFKPERSSYNLGAKVTMISETDLAVELNYDFEYKSDYFNHSGYGVIRKKF